MKHLNEYNEYITAESQEFFNSCKSNDIESVKRMLDAGVHPHKFAYYQGTMGAVWYPVQIASLQNSIEILKLLFADERVDVRIDDDSVLTTAAECGYVSMLAFILKDGRCDPTAQYNQSMRVACIDGQTAMVEMLLKDGRCDPTADDNEALEQALAYEHVGVVGALIVHPDVDPAAGRNKALVYAVSKQNEELVDLLLDNSRVLDIIGQIPFEHMKPMLLDKLVKIFDLNDEKELIELLPLMK